MDEYLDLMFGNAPGYVAVAYKGPRSSWQEQQFEWPTDARKLRWWAKQHRAGDLFICPALRQDPHTRKKGDGTNLRWLWADVDWDKVPADKRELVVRRIQQVGTYVVSSGTADNAHVYVRLSRVVSVEEHYRLNTGLRDYLYADAKHADNSLLRLPGSLNHKHKPGGVVKRRGGHDKAIKPETLLKLRAFARVQGVATNGVTDWTLVDTSDISRRWVRLANMSPDEALGRYGKRHVAVWAIVGDLHNAGLSDDQIHTLLDGCPIEVDKRADEHGAYDIHRDIGRRLAAIANAERVIDEGGDLEDAIRELTPEEEARENDKLVIDPEVARLIQRQDRYDEAKRIRAERSFVVPSPDRIHTLASLQANPPQPAKYLVDGILGVKHNAVLTAQWKSGKTTFALDLAKSLVDGDPFLGEIEVARKCRVHFWSLEVETDELFRDFAHPMQFNNPEQLSIFDGVGHTPNILTEAGKAWTVAQLTDHDVWIIDSLSVLAVWAGVNIDKDNIDTRRLFAAIDEIKVRSGVQVSIVLAHTPRAEMEEGKERARGASAIDEHAGARWILTVEGGIRFLSVNGRGVALTTTSLVFDAETKRSVLGVEGKANVADDARTQVVLELVQGAPGVLKTTLLNMVKRRLQCGTETARDAIEEAVSTGWVERRRETRSSGGRAQQKHYPSAVENGADGGVGATSRAVDFRRTGRPKNPKVGRS